VRRREGGRKGEVIPRKATQRYWQAAELAIDGRRLKKIVKKDGALAVAFGYDQVTRTTGYILFIGIRTLCLTTGLLVKKSQPPARVNQSAMATKHESKASPSAAQQSVEQQSTRRTVASSRAESMDETLGSR